MESELSKTKLEYAERIQVLQQQLEDSRQKEMELKDMFLEKEHAWKEATHFYKEDIDRLKKQHMDEKQRIEQQSVQAIEQIRLDIEALSENKTEQEQQVQEFKLNLGQKQ